MAPTINTVEDSKTIYLNKAILINLKRKTKATFVLWKSLEFQYARDCANMS